MPKRIALFILGVVLAVSAFLLYQSYSGTNLKGGIGGSQKGAVAPKGDGSKLGDVVELRDEFGRLEALITAAKAPEPVKDEAGNAIPGRFRVESPVATLYDKSGRTVEIRADEGTVTVETGPKGVSMGGTGLAGITGGGKGIPLRTGQLRGNVRLTISEQPPPDPAETQPSAGGSRPELEGGMRIYFDGPVSLEHSSDLSQEIIKSEGGVHIRSERAEFDGVGLQLVFNGRSSKIESLLIEKGDQIVIREVGKDALTLAGATTAPAANLAAAAAASQPAAAGGAVAAGGVAAATKPAKEVRPAQPYKLSFGQNVRTEVVNIDAKDAAVVGTSLTCEQLYLLFMTGDFTKDKKDKAGAAQALAGGAGVAGAVEGANQPALAVGPATAPKVWPDRPAPIAPAVTGDLVIRWTGPMEMRPTDEKDLKLADGSDIALEAVGSAEKPVMVKDQQFTAMAGRLWYHRAEERIKLEPGDFKRVELTDIARGTVVCMDADILQKENRAVLLGPGTLTVAAKPPAEGKVVKTDDAGPTVVAWTTRMDLDLIDGKADPKNPGRKGNPLIRMATIVGADIRAFRVGAATDTLDLSFKLTGDLLKVLIATVDDEKGKPTPVLENLLATGNVAVDSYHAGAAGGEPDGLRAPRMEIRTAIPAGGKAPIPTQLIADGGEVSVWRFVEKKAKATATARGTPVVAVANVPRLWEKDLVTAGKLVADLSPRAKEKSADTKDAPAGAANFTGLEQAFEATHILATEGVKIDITPPEVAKRIVATANQLDADILGGKATLAGAAEMPVANVIAGAVETGLVRVAIGAAGDNSIEGRSLVLANLLNDEEVTLTVPGAGRFQFTLPADKDRGRPDPVPLDIAWTDRMNFSNKTKLAEFLGKTVVQSRGKGAELAKLSADKLLQVQLKNRVASATRPAAAGPAESDMELESIYAEGNVDAGGAHLNELGEIDSFMDLQAEKLRYTDATKMFEVPVAGTLVVEDKRAAKKDDLRNEAAVKEAANRQGLSTFRWKGSLIFDGLGNLITFSDGVEFNFKPKEPFTFLPGSSAGTSRVQKDTIATLTTNRLVATLMKPKADTTGKPVDSPIGLGGDLSLVEAKGNATLSVGSDYRATGNLMSFDVPGNVAKLIGSADHPVLLERLGEIPVLAEQVIWYMKREGKQGNDAFEMKGVRTNIPGR